MSRSGPVNLVCPEPECRALIPAHRGRFHEGEGMAGFMIRLRCKVCRTESVWNGPGLGWAIGNTDGRPIEWSDHMAGDWRKAAAIGKLSL